MTGTTPIRPLLSLDSRKLAAMGVGGVLSMGSAAIAKVRSDPPDADGTSFMRRDRAEAKAYFSGPTAPATVIPLLGALLCVPMLYGWPRGLMLDETARAAMSTGAKAEAAQHVGALATGLDAAIPANQTIRVGASELAKLSPTTRRELGELGVPLTPMEGPLTQMLYGMGGAGFFGGWLLNGPVIFHDDQYDTRHFPKGSDPKVTPGTSD